MIITVSKKAIWITIDNQSYFNVVQASYMGFTCQAVNNNKFRRYREPQIKVYD